MRIHAQIDRAGYTDCGRQRDAIRPYDEENTGFEDSGIQSEISACCHEDTVSGGYVPSWDRERTAE